MLLLSYLKTSRSLLNDNSSQVLTNILERSRWICSFTSSNLFMLVVSFCVSFLDSYLEDSTSLVSCASTIKSYVSHITSTIFIMSCVSEVASTYCMNSFVSHVASTIWISSYVAHVKVNLGVQSTFILIWRRCSFKGMFSRAFRHL